MSSVPILISPDAGNCVEFATTIFVVIRSVKAVDNVVVAIPEAVPPKLAVPQPNPPNCCDGPML